MSPQYNLADSNVLRVVSLHSISFFQLSHKVPERGISLLLAFLRSLSLLSSFVYSDHILQLRKGIPRNAYFFKNMYGTNSCTIAYVVCPRRIALYDWRNCIIKKHNTLVESAKCTFTSR